jgi:hypothetical protein
MSEKQPGSPSQTMLTGALIVVGSGILMLLPLVTGAKIGRFIVVIALIGMLIGASIALNGLIDRWQRGGGA